MKVWSNSWYAKELKEQVIFSGEIFVHRITDYFSPRSYGIGVQEIFYVEICENPVFSKNEYVDLLHYNKSEKKIEIGLELDFEVAINMTGYEFARYLANRYMEISLDIEELNIQEFDLTNYLKDLEFVFKRSSIL